MRSASIKAGGPLPALCDTGDRCKDRGPPPAQALDLPAAASAHAPSGVNAPDPATLAIDAGLGAPPGRATRRGAVAWTAVLSMLLHAAIGIWIAVAVEPDSIGAGGVDLEAVSLEVIEASELQPAAVVSAAQEGNGDEAREAIADLVPKPEIVLAIKPPEALLPPDPPSAEEPEVAAAPKQAQTVEATPEEQPKEPLPEEHPPVEGTAEVRQAGQDATAAGGLVTDNTATAVAAQAATSATAGELRQYALAVRLAIGKARPRHTGARGKVVVVFTVGEDGRVEAPSVARSSGDARLDADALAAIARSTLPPPPVGATAQQRTFLIPFDFR